jgi:hypothetical protein
MPAIRMTFVAFFLLACLLVPAALHAAVISGHITDASTEKPVVFATVKILELDRQSHTDADGRYVFNDLPAGRYTIAVSFAGYSDYAIGVLDSRRMRSKRSTPPCNPTRRRCTTETRRLHRRFRHVT